MKTFIALAMAALVCTLSTETFGQGQEGPPAWAYPVNPPDFKLPPDDGTLRRVPASAVAFTLTQVRDRFFAPDWHPADHARMPEIVAQGRKPEVFACGFCHRADGPGGPENANLTGLPAAFIVQQMADFKSGARKSSVQKRAPTELKALLVKAVTDAEVQAAAAYFSAVKPRSIVTVVETDMAPKSYVTGWHLAAEKSGEKEPIGQRIIEVPEDLERFVSRDARSRFIAYVPVGSIQKGRELAATGGGGKTVQCGVCHGPELKGVGPIPGIAGRSPSYIVRQLYDFKYGARAGLASALMKPSVEQLTVDDMLVLAAYAASLTP
jgi:cytochrome c553